MMMRMRMYDVLEEMELMNKMKEICLYNEI